MQICIVFLAILMLISFDFIMFVCLFSYESVTFISLVLMVDFVFYTCFYAQIMHEKDLELIRTNWKA